MNLLPTLCLLVLCIGLSPVCAQARDHSELPLPYGRDFVRVDQLAGVAPQPLQSAPEGAAHLRRVDELQWQGGPYGQALSEGLLDAANYFESRGDLDQMRQLLRRAVHVIRINDGLYSTLQQPLLQRLFDSYLQHGDIDTAAEIQDWLFHLGRATNAVGSSLAVAATIQYSDWELRRWLLAPELEDQDRLYRIWRLLEAQYPPPEEPLLPVATQAALVYAQLRLLYLVGVLELGADAQMDLMQGARYARLSGPPETAVSQLQLLQRSAFSQGIQRLQALAARLDTQGDVETRAEVAKQLADWQLWYGNYTPAAEQYQQSWRLIAGQEYAGLREQWYGSPVELPADAVLYPALEQLSAGEKPQRVWAQFSVSERGRPEQIETREVSPAGAAAADAAAAGAAASESYKLHRWLKASRFRPRLDEGEMVATPAVLREYQLR